MRKIDLTKGNVFKSLLIFALPVFGIYFFNSLYNAVDIFILSLANAESQIGMVASAYTPINLSIALLTGCGVASTFLIAQYVGGKDEAGKLKACKTVIIFSIGFGLFLMAVVLAFSPLIIKGLNIQEDLKDYALRYLLIQTLILPLNGIIFATHAICKGHGKSLLPGIYSGLGVVFNIIYDFVFIYALNLKSDGAAIASVASYLTAAIIVLSYVFFIKFKCHNPLKGVKSDLHMYQHLIKQVIPLSIQEAFVIICFIVLISTINLRQGNASNVIAISDRITNLSYAPMMAFSNAVSAAVAQNLGNNDIKRTNKIVWTAVYTLIGFAIIYSLPLYLFSKELAGLYTHDIDTINQVWQRSWVIFIDLLMCVIMTPLNGLASGSGNSKWSLAIYMVGDIVLRIPLTLILGLYNYPIWVVSIAYPASSAIGVIIALIFYFTKKWQNLKALPVNVDKVSENN